MLRKILYICTIFLMLFSCKSEDHYYKEYLENAELYYPGTLDSLSLYPGNGRAQVHMKLSTDPKIKKLRVVMANDLNAALDTFFYDVTSAEAGKVKDVFLENLNETRYTVSVRGFSAEGDSSKAISATAAIEGPRYAGTVLSLNRVFRYFATSPAGNRQAVFLVETVGNGFSPLQGTWVYFVRNDESRDSVYMEAIDFAVEFPSDIKPSGSISFVSLYKKTETSLDAFETEEKIVNY